MAEEEAECHFCNMCGADDTSASFYKDCFDRYWCPDCRKEYLSGPDLDILPCPKCGKKPMVDVTNCHIECIEKHQGVCDLWFPFSHAVIMWNSMCVPVETRDG